MPRLRERWESRERCGRWRGRALRIPFRLWCRATEWCARMETLLDTGGGFRGKKNYWNGSARKRPRRISAATIEEEKDCSSLALRNDGRKNEGRQQYYFS